MQDKTAAQTLDDIREGSVKIVLLTRQRLSEAQTALEEGRFTDTHKHIGEALQRIVSLSDAQQYLGGWSDLYVLRGHELEIGMRFYGHSEHGVIADIEDTPKDCTNHGTHVMRKLTFTDGFELGVDSLLEYVVHAEAEVA